MSGLRDTLHELHQQRKERWEERREGRGRGRGRGHRNDDYDDYEQQQQYGQRHHQGNDNDRPAGYQSQGGYAPPSGPPPSMRGQRAYQGDDDDFHRPQSYQGQDQGRSGGGYAAPPGPPSSIGFGGLDRGDFASDADIDRMVATGEFDKRQAPGRQGYGYSGVDQERREAHGRYDAPPGPGQGYGERASEYGLYDAPSGPPSGRGHQSQQYSEQGYGSEYGDRPNQYGSQTQGRTQYEAPQGPPLSHGRSQGNAPAGGFGITRDGDDDYRSGPTNHRSETPRRGEAADYYDQRNSAGRGDDYGHLARLAQEHGDDDPELYRRATTGLHEKIQAQQTRRRRDDDDEDYKTHVDAHRKAYGGDDDDGPMDADSIGAAAAMEAIKQTAAAAKSSKAPAGGFQASKTSAGPSSKDEPDTSAARGGGGLQDKLMALAMSHAGKLFDKKNAASGGGKSEDKAQAMQSAAATAMQLFAKYQTGKLDSSDMTSVMTLAMKML